MWVSICKIERQHSAWKFKRHFKRPGMNNYVWLLCGGCQSSEQERPGTLVRTHLVRHLVMSDSLSILYYIVYILSYCLCLFSLCARVRDVFVPEGQSCVIKCSIYWSHSIYFQRVCPGPWSFSSRSFVSSSWKRKVKAPRALEWGTNE